jgi:hypothetical protein
VSERPKTEPPIIGYEAIAAATGRAIGRSVVPKTAKNWAHQNPAKRPKHLRNRLPVCKYPDGRVYLLPADLAVWAAAWLAPLPSGAQLPGRAA